MISTTTCQFSNPVCINNGVIGICENNGNSFQFSRIDCVNNSTTTEILYNGTTTAQIINGFTYGEIMTGFLLLLIALMLFFGGITNQISGVKNRARNTRNGRIQ